VESIFNLSDWFFEKIHSNRSFKLYIECFAHVQNNFKEPRLIVSDP